MAKTVTISKSEYEYLKEANKTDGLTIAQLQAQLAQATEDIRQLLVISTTHKVCDYCKRDPAECQNCEECAEWRGSVFEPEYT